MRTNKAEKGLSILGSIVAGILSYGCAAKQVNATYMHEGGKPVYSAGYKQDNLSGICLADDKKLEAKVQGFEDVGKFRCETFSVEGLSTSEESLDSRKFLNVRKSFFLNDKTGYVVGFAHAGAVYDESCTKTSEDNVTVDTSTKISGISLGVGVANTEKHFKVGVGYDFRKEDDTVTVNLGGNDISDKFSATVEQISVDGEAVFKDKLGDIKHNVGGCVTFGYGDNGIESTTTGDLWYTLFFNKNTSATFSGSLNDDSNEFSVMLTSGHEDYDKLNAIRDYIKGKRSGALNTLNLAHGPAIERLNHNMPYNLYHLILTSGQAGRKLEILGEYIFENTADVKTGITYGFTFKDTGEFGGLLGVKFVK